MSVLVLLTVPNPDAQFAAGALFAGTAVLLPLVARWTVLAAVLGLSGMAGIIAVFTGSVDALLEHATWFIGNARLMAPTLAGMVAGKFIVGLLIGR